LQQVMIPLYGGCVITILPIRTLAPLSLIELLQTLALWTPSLSLQPLALAQHRFPARLSLGADNESPVSPFGQLQA
jgi:hypothetical protein